MVDIFISYAREDRPQAERLARALQGEKFDVWWDLESLRSGQSFNRAIQQALEQAKCVIVLWSGTSVTSKWVEAEAYWAWEHNKLHSVRLDDTLPLPVPFNIIHARSLASWNDSSDYPEFQRLTADIAAVVGRPKSDAEKPPPPHPVTAQQPAEPSKVQKRKALPRKQRPTQTTKTQKHPQLASPAPHSRTPGTIFCDSLRNGREGPEMVVIPAGGFWMGSPGAQLRRAGSRHRVEIPRPYSLGKTPVTFADYDLFADLTGKEKPNDNGWDRGDRPVIYVMWHDALAYAEWLSDQTGRHYRLLSEAEWEYACRAGTETPWSFGNQEGDLAKYAWYGTNSGERTHVVGEKESNPWGLHDFHGNVWEWVQDCWHDSYKAAPTDGSAWQEANSGDCSQRVVRGGSWGNKPEYLCSAKRYRYASGARNAYLGFRLARDLDN